MIFPRNFIGVPGLQAGIECILSGLKRIGLLPNPNDADLVHCNRFRGLVTRINGNPGDLIQYIQSLHDLAKYGVLPVKP